MQTLNVTDLIKSQCLFEVTINRKCTDLLKKIQFSPFFSVQLMNVPYRLRYLQDTLLIRLNYPHSFGC